MVQRRYNLFISHAWDYSERYDGIVKLLNSDATFNWANYSAPKSDPLVDPNSEVGVRKLTSLIDEQIRQSSCFILVAGMFVNHRFWIQKEINIAQYYNKPIVGVRRRNQQVTPQAVSDVSDRLVNWYSASIISAIKEVC